jgi:hypothetical protein
MKTLFIYALWLIVGIISTGYCYSQFNNPNPIEKWEQEIMKKKKVKTCYITYYDINDDDQEVINKDYDSVYYDRNGNQTKVIWGFSTSRTNFRYVDEYFYNQKNQLVNSTSLEYENGLCTDTIHENYLYDDKGQLIKSYYVATGEPLDSCSYSYKNGKLISSVKYGVNFVCDYKNDTCHVYLKNSISGSEYCYVKDRQILHKSESRRYQYIYNEKGYLIYYRFYENDVLKSEYAYEYKNDLVNKCTTSTSHEKEDSREYYKYEYY